MARNSSRCRRRLWQAAGGPEVTAVELASPPGKVAAADIALSAGLALGNALGGAAAPTTVPDANNIGADVPRTFREGRDECLEWVFALLRSG